MKRPGNPISFSFNNHVSVKRQCQETEPRLSVQQQRRQLPVYKVRKRLLKEIEKHDTLIVIGETGSGKTTQIPQLIHELKLVSGTIGITQPRRVAAITVAQRVAKEMNQDVGGTVGYLVRFEDTTCANTKIKYLTDGMLLREAMADPMLKNYSFIILDEAHERTIHTDVLFVIIKNAQKTRDTAKPLKVIVMSATMDVDNFSKYFNNAPIIYLEGRQFSVKIYHTSKPIEDYNYTCLSTIFNIHQNQPLSGDILVFLTGQEEIEAMASNIRCIMKDTLYNGPNASVNTLYAALSPSKQMEVFQASHPNTRKIILSTNIAETSITIPGIKYIVDSGKVKSRSFHAATGVECLKVESISQAQAWQRTGRAGRDSNGFCYRAYSQQDYENLMKSTKPEILRCNLSTVLLQLLKLKVNALTFDFMDKPTESSIEEGYKVLKLLGAIESVEEPKLTELGDKMCYFPLDPRFSNIILSAHQHSCVEEVITVIAILSGENIFVNNTQRRDDIMKSRSKFYSTAGDHVTLLNIYRAYSQANNKRIWCLDNFINMRNMEYACKVRKQLLEICHRNGVRVNRCPQFSPDNNDTLDEIHDKLTRSLLSGLFMNLAQLKSDKQYTVVGTRQVVSIHPSSSLHYHRVLPPLVLFTELIQTNKNYIRYLSPVDISNVKDILPQSVLSNISIIG